MTDPIHFATRIDADTGTYTAICGYMGFNGTMFINGRDPNAATKNTRGEWRITCEKCQEKIVSCDGGGIA